MIGKDQVIRTLKSRVDLSIDAIFSRDGALPDESFKEVEDNLKIISELPI
jgi:hypothetical protein